MIRTSFNKVTGGGATNVRDCISPETPEATAPPEALTIRQAAEITVWWTMLLPLMVRATGGGAINARACTLAGIPEVIVLLEGHTIVPEAETTPWLIMYLPVLSRATGDGVTNVRVCTSADMPRKDIVRREALTITLGAVITR
jgi:hypothetical protein